MTRAILQSRVLRYHEFMNFLRRNSLLFLVCITGASVLVVEVIGVRILSPYFGNTIYSFSSILGVVLAALSIGYYVGGIFADKHPHERWFFGIIFVSGITVLGIQLLQRLVLPLIGYNLSIVSGPLIASLVLFFVPCVLLGMLSPFVVTLQKLRAPEQGIGSVAGKVFFWSTIGSIAGSLLAGFVLIPRFGIDEILVTVGIILLILGMKVFFGGARGAKKVTLAVVAAAVLLGGVVSASPSNSALLYSREGLYQRIVLYDGEYNSRPARFFMQDRWVSGGIYLDSDEHVFDYTKYYALYKMFKPDTKRTLVLGGGVYIVPKALLQETAELTVDVVEIEPELVSLAHRYFGLPLSERLHNHVTDGRRFLYDTQEPYDMIFSDVYYSLYSIPVHFTTKEFFELAQARLSSEGVFIANLVGSLAPGKNDFILSEMKTFREAFPNSYFFAVTSPETSDIQNIMFVGHKSDARIDIGSEENQKRMSQLIPDLSSKLIDVQQLDFASAITMTDNYAPVDYLMAKLLKDI